jgi:hypothetical protein
MEPPGGGYVPTGSAGTLKAHGGTGVTVTGGGTLTFTTGGNGSVDFNDHHIEYTGTGIIQVKVTFAGIQNCWYTELFTHDYN